MVRSIPGVALGAVIALSLAACGGADPDPQDTAGASAQDRMLVVVTTSILGDIVGSVVGDDASVDVLMGPGQDPHGFAPSARQGQALREADLVVANGLQLEETLVDVLAAAEADGVPVLRLAERLDPIAFQDEDDDHAEDAEDEPEVDHGHGEFDPHVWLDPVRMADGARVIADELAAVDDRLDDDEWARRGERAAQEIEAAHAEVEQILAAVPDRCRQLVTNHDAIGYLAHRYGFEVIGTVVPGATTQADPSAREFAALASLLRETTVPAIFAENIASTRLAESLAAEVGRDIEIVELYTDALGDPGSGADTYVGLLTTDARLIADALSDC